MGKRAPVPVVRIDVGNGQRVDPDAARQTSSPRLHARGPRPRRDAGHLSGSRLLPRPHRQFRLPREPRERAPARPDGWCATTIAVRPRTCNNNPPERFVAQLAELPGPNTSSRPRSNGGHRAPKLRPPRHRGRSATRTGKRAANVVALGGTWRGHGSKRQYAVAVHELLANAARFRRRSTHAADLTRTCSADWDVPISGRQGMFELPLRPRKIGVAESA